MNVDCSTVSIVRNNPIDLSCALLSLRTWSIRKPFSAFRYLRGIIKGESCRCALSFRFFSIPGRSARGREGRRRRGSEKERNENVTLDDARNRRLIGSSESQSARSDLTRPGPARDRVLQRRFRRDGSGPRCQSVFLGRVRGPSQAIGYS